MLIEVQASVAFGEEQAGCRGARLTYSSLLYTYLHSPLPLTHYQLWRVPNNGCGATNPQYVTEARTWRLLPCVDHGVQRLRHRVGYANLTLYAFGCNGQWIGLIETSSTTAVCTRRWTLSAPVW